MIAFVLTLLFLLQLLVGGFLLLRLIARWDEPQPAERWLSISFGLGVGFQAFAYILSLLLFGYLSVAFYGVLFVLLVGGNIVFRRSLHRLEMFGGFDFVVGPESREYRSLYWLAALLGVIFIVVLYYNAMDYPMASYDGRAIWNYKAKILYTERTVHTGSFLDPTRVHYHRDYPLLVPLTEFSFYAFTGHIDEDQVRFFFTSIMLFFGLFLYGTLRHRTSRPVALFMALLFMGLPFREYWVVRDGGAINSGEADFPLSFLATIAIVCWSRWWSGKNRTDLLLGGIFSGFCLMTKKEGLVVFAVLAGVNGIMWIFTSGGRRTARLGWVAGGTIIAVAVAAPWIILSRRLPNYYDENYLAMFTWDTLRYGWTRLHVIWAIFHNDITETDKWSWFWYFYPLAIIAGIACSIRKKHSFFLGLAIILWLSAYAVVYMLSPLNLVFHLNTSLRRLLAHVFPLIVLETGFLLDLTLRAVAPAQNGQTPETLELPLDARR